MSSSLGFFYIGYNCSLMNPLSVVLGQMYGWGDDNQTYLSVANCLFFVGNFLGSILGGRLIEQFSKRKVFLVTDILGILAMCVLVAKSTALFMTGRLCCGIASGLYSTIIPVYTTETTPKDQQGKYGCIYHLQLPIGVTTTFALATLLPTSGHPSNHYIFNHWTSSMIIFPALLILIKFFLFLLIFKQDTPYDMIKQNKNKIDIIKELRKSYKMNECQFELESMLSRKSVQQNQLQVQDMFSRKYRRQFILGICLACGFQFLCVSTISCYSVMVFQQVEHMTSQEAIRWSFCFCLLEILGNVLAILFMDKVGKKIMLQGGYLLMIVCLLVMSITAWFQVDKAQPIIYCVYFLITGLTYDNLVYIYIADLVPGIGFGICIGITYLLGGILSLLFPYLNNSLIGYPGTMLIFFAISLSLFLIFQIFLPDTTGLNFQEVFDLFQKQNDNVNEKQILPKKQDTCQFQ